MYLCKRTTLNRSYRTRQFHVIKLYSNNTFVQDHEDIPLFMLKERYNCRKSFNTKHGPNKPRLNGGNTFDPHNSHFRHRGSKHGEHIKVPLGSNNKTLFTFSLVHVSIHVTTPIFVSVTAFRLGFLPKFRLLPLYIYVLLFSVS